MQNLKPLTSVCGWVGSPGRKHRRQVFSWCSSITFEFDFFPAKQPSLSPLELFLYFFQVADDMAQKEGKHMVFRKLPRAASIINMPVVTTLFYCCLYHYEEPEVGSRGIWAASWQNKQNGMCAQQIRVFAVRMKKAWVLSYPLSTKRRLIRLGGCPGWSASHSNFVGFVMKRLMVFVLIVMKYLVWYC